MIKRMRWIIWILLGIFLIYLAVSVYFMEHFFMGTIVNGKNVEFDTAQEIGEDILAEAREYTLTLTGRDGSTETLTVDQLGITFSETETIHKLKRSQNGFLWPRMFLQQDIYDVIPEMTVDEDVILETVQSLGIVLNGEEPENAWVEMTDDGYVVHEAEEGSVIDANALAAAIAEAVTYLPDTLEISDDVYEDPEITSESQEIAELVSQLDTWLGVQITYEFGSDTVEVDKSVIAGFITLDGYEATLNEDAVTEWVAYLAEATDTYKSKRSFNSTLRGTISVSGGSYGWLMDQETESAELYASIEAGETVTKEPAYSRTASVRSGLKDDIGSTYIEVDMSAQHMWAYIDGELLIETDVVTGNIIGNNGTPELVASIQYKQRDAVLNGADYSTPVNFWMPFYGNYGLHDATWRSSFGGDIYLTNGSHGCVNTPYAAMKVIFENIDTGTPVVLYY